MRYVLIGDGESPHLLKWARALAQVQGIELWAASSRGFAAGFDAAVPLSRCLALNTQPRAQGGNAALLLELPRLARWLRYVRADWLHAHYLSSHGTLSWLAQRFCGVGGRLVGSAWGSDILLAPRRSIWMRWLTRRVLQHCVLTTSDSQVMAQEMRMLGARDVMVFPFGLEVMPPAPQHKEPHLFFANRGLEPIYDPLRVIDVFAGIAAHWPDATLVVANLGSMLAATRAHASALGERVQFVGRLDAATQATWYSRASWYLSLPKSDSVAVSVLEAMAHGCVPILSDLPANRELVHDGGNGIIVDGGTLLAHPALQNLAGQAERIGADNRAWVQQHALFGPCVQAFLARLRTLSA